MSKDKMKMEEESDAGKAFIPRSVFGKMDLKPGQTVSMSIVDLEDGENGEDGEVQVKVMGDQEEEAQEGSDKGSDSESPMMAGIDSIPDSRTE